MNTSQPSFRDVLPTSTQSGGRQWLYPRMPSGRYTNWRTVLAWVLLAFFFIGPFIWVDGHPLFLFDVMERRFILFGVTFWPQDFYLLALGMLTFILFIALFTLVYGRVWCGWACPQTIFMEMVFRKIEVWIEGDSNARRKLDAAPWTTNKIVKKSLKHVIFFLISFLISNTFLAYLIGRDQWLALVTDNPLNHLGNLAALLLFTAVFYLVFAKVREIVCTTICPYGRLQGVLLDKQSLVVTYDPIRGEPRGKRKRTDTEATRTTGDCIDCHLCVHVCPTGIDIRNGTQMECVNCTACIDACDDVMDKISRPRGLIRIDSQVGVEEQKPFRLTPRIIGISAVLVLLLGVLVYLLATREPMQATLLRAPGQLFQREANGRISNLYVLEVINKTYEPKPVQFRVNHPNATVRFVQPMTDVPAGDLAKTTLFISLPEADINESSIPLEIDILSDNEVVDHLSTTFLGPMP